MCESRYQRKLVGDLTCVSIPPLRWWPTSDNTFSVYDKTLFCPWQKSFLLLTKLCQICLRPIRLCGSSRSLCTSSSSLSMSKLEQCSSVKSVSSQSSVKVSRTYHLSPILYNFYVLETLNKILSHQTFQFLVRHLWTRTQAPSVHTTLIQKYFECPWTEKTISHE